MICVILVNKYGHIRNLAMIKSIIQEEDDGHQKKVPVHIKKTAHNDLDQFPDPACGISAYYLQS